MTPLGSTSTSSNSAVRMNSARKSNLDSMSAARCSLANSTMPPPSPRTWMKVLASGTCRQPRSMAMPKKSSRVIGWGRNWIMASMTRAPMRAQTTIERWLMVSGVMAVRGTKGRYSTVHFFEARPQLIVLGCSIVYERRHSPVKGR